MDMARIAQAFRLGQKISEARVAFMLSASLPASMLISPPAYPGELAKQAKAQFNERYLGRGNHQAQG